MESNWLPPDGSHVRHSTERLRGSAGTAHADEPIRGTEAGSGSGFRLRPDAYRDTLYREFAPLVNRLLRQYGNTLEQRQDLSGEIYWQFCCHLEAYDPERGVPLRPYIVRVLSASVYTYARKQWKLNSREAFLDSTDTDCLALSLDPTPQWIHNLSQQQIIAALPMSLSQLPKRQRLVVLLRYYEQRSFEEIAELLDIKAATARSLLRHGVQSLRKYIHPLSSQDM